MKVNVYYNLSYLLVSAFYAEHFNKKISLDGYIWTKSKFLGLSIGVHMIGQGVISVIDHDEEYTITFPNGYGRQVHPNYIMSFLLLLLKKNSDCHAGVHLKCYFHLSNRLNPLVKNTKTRFLSIK